MGTLVNIILLVSDESEDVLLVNAPSRKLRHRELSHEPYTDKWGCIYQGFFVFKKS